MIRSLFAVGALSLFATDTAAQSAAPTPPAATADLETCALRSGAEIRGCRLLYRTFGALSAERDNAVLIPTWFVGRSQDWIPILGPEGMVDTTRYFVIVVDALGNGASSSPSTSQEQRGRAFPAISIGDMVDAQKRLIVEHLRIPRLHAVLGASKGGMQALEWAAAYPEHVDRVISITGTPRSAPYDRLIWTQMLSMITDGRRHGVPDDSIYAQLGRQMQLALTGPARVNAGTADQAEAAARTSARTMRDRMSLDDLAVQLRAMIAHDVSARHGGDLDAAARAMRPGALLVYSPDDLLVTSTPASQFARAAGADTLSLPSDCGHLVTGCEARRIHPAIRRFLDRR